MSTQVAVVGGGLAGITTALSCADAGLSVSLFESRGGLGGLTHSFRRGDLHVDNGQHVFMRCCDRYLALLERLGTRDQVELQPRLDISVRDANTGRTSRLRRGRLPAPLQLAWSFARYAPLRPAARARAAAATWALRSVPIDDPRTDRQSFGQWLSDHGQSEPAVEALWDLVGVATLNAPAPQASLALAAMVFQVGLLGQASAADLGWSRVPLRQLHGDAALGALTHAGVRVFSHAPIRRIDERPSGWALRSDDDEYRADQVVLATPPEVAASLLPTSADVPAGVGSRGNRPTPSAPPGWAHGLGHVPIVNIHLVYDRQVMVEPFLAGIGTPVQWIFDRTRPSGLREGQYLALSLSAADDLIDEPVARLRERFVPEVCRLLPAARDAQLRDFFVTRERRATFRPAPGTAELRPGTDSGIAGVYLAGAWTATGWPATMEGAVRSGEAAARAVCAAVGTAAPHACSRVEDLPV